MEILFKKNTIVILAVLLAWMVPGFLHAATLYFSPSSGSYQPGQTFSVSALVSSSDEAMNAASATVIFPKDALEVTSISKGNSIFNLWVQEPTFSNSQGTVNFEGIVLNPGFVGPAGRILTINFRTKKQGSPTISFSSGSVLANDGKGTDILTGLGKATFSIAEENNEPVSTPPVVSEAERPTISSPTHSDQNTWYANSTPKFEWDLPSGVTAVRLLYDKNPLSEGGVLYAPPIFEKDIPNVADGIYYFHAQFRNGAAWGRSSHFRFQIDTEKPEYFTIQELRRSDPTNPNARFTFDSKDSLSGIDHYEIKIDDGEPQAWQDDGTHIFETYPIDPGSHTLVAKAFDKAGNFLETSVDFSVTPLGKISITSYPSQLQSGDTLLIDTKGPPNTRTVLFLQRGEEGATQYIMQSNRNGVSMFAIEDSLKEGSYEAWAVAMDAKEAKSYPSEKVKIVVTHPTLLKVSSFATTFLAIAIPIIALLFLMLFLLYWLWHKFSLFRKALRQEAREAENTLHAAFHLLRANTKEHVALLEKANNQRKLTTKEQTLLKKFKQDLNSAEKLIEKEIKDIDKKLRK